MEVNVQRMKPLHEKMVTFYFKGKSCEYHLFYDFDEKDIHKKASDLIKRRYCCKDDDFDILSVQEVVFNRI